MINKKISFWKMIWRPLSLGILVGTVPGFYIGKILPWREESLLPWFWVATVLLAVASILVSIQLFTGMYRTLVERGTSRIFNWAGYLLFFLLLVSIGCFFAGYFWWATGRIALASAKKDVMDAGYHWGPPENAPVLPDNDNSVYWFNRAWNASSMRRFGSPLPIYDHPPKGRFEENTRKYELQKNKDDFSARPFFYKETEDVFLSAFTHDADLGRLTPEEKKYARRSMEEHEDAFLLMDKAVQVKGVDWGIDYRVSPWDIPVPRESYYLAMARLIQARAMVQAMDGDTKGAVKSLETGFVLADVMSQVHSLIGEVIGMAIRKIVMRPAHYVFSRPHLSGKSEAEFLRFLPQEKWMKEFDDSMQYEFFNEEFPFEKISWFGFLKEGRWGTFIYPFALYDRASLYEVDLQLMKNLRNPPEIGKLAERFQLTGWLLGSMVFPKFNQMFENSNETLTKCGLAEVQISADLFHSKNGRWPNNEAELEKTFRQTADGRSGNFPAVMATGLFVKDSKPPVGDEVSLAEKGRTPTNSGSGWLYDSNVGTVYVNSTVKDSKDIPYSFYGFE